MAENLLLTTSLTLGDYVELRAFYLRQYILRNSAIFFGFLLAGLFLIPLAGGMGPRIVLRVLARDWNYYASIILAVFLLVRAVPFISLLALWFRGTLPRHLSMNVSDDGLRYTLLQTDVLLYWAAISSIARTQNAYYIDSKTRIVRLPRRELTQTQCAEFERLAARFTVLTDIWRPFRFWNWKTPTGS